MRARRSVPHYKDVISENKKMLLSSCFVLGNFLLQRTDNESPLADSETNICTENK